MAIKTLKRYQPVLEHYSDIRGNFLRASESYSSSPSQVITDRHGFFLQQPNFGSLGSRFASLDKLFYTLIQGIVDDPDFALQKDPKIYDKMMRDPQIFYCLGVRKAAISGLPWTVKTQEGMERDPMAQRIAQEAEKRLRQIPRFAELLDNIQDALLPGMSVNELVWNVTKQGSYVIKNHFPVNKDRIKFDKEGRLYLLSPKAPTTGQLCPPYKFVTHIYNTTDGSWTRPETAGYSYYGRGLADTPLYHYFYFKMLALKFLMKELERYGLPFKLFYSGPQNQELANKMSEVMTALRNDSVVGIPGKKGDIDVDVVSTQRSGNIFILFINYVDSLITKTILGQELMTEMPGVGSYAAASIHRSVFGLINEQDRQRVKDTLNRTLLRFDAQLNLPNIKEDYYPRFDFKKAPVEEVLSFLETVEAATRLGITVSVKQVREYTGLREPGKDEEVVEIPEPQFPEPGFGGATPPSSTSPKSNFKNRIGGNGNGKNNSGNNRKKKPAGKTQNTHGRAKMS